MREVAQEEGFMGNLERAALVERVMRVMEGSPTLAEAGRKLKVTRERMRVLANKADAELGIVHPKKRGMLSLKEVLKLLGMRRWQVTECIQEGIVAPERFRGRLYFNAKSRAKLCRWRDRTFVCQVCTQRKKIVESERYVGTLRICKENQCMKKADRFRRKNYLAEMALGREVKRKRSEWIEKFAMFVRETNLPFDALRIRAGEARRLSGLSYLNLDWLWRTKVVPHIVDTVRSSSGALIRLYFRTHMEKAREIREELGLVPRAVQKP